MIWSIAWRNVWRNKLRSLIIILSVTIGVLGGTIFYASSLGMMNRRVESAINNEISNIQLHHPEYLLNEEIKYTINNSEEITNTIKNIQGVKAVSSRIKAQAMASTAETATGVIITGIDPENERRVTNIHEQIEDGKYLDKNDHIPIVIGRKLAKKLNARLKSRIVINTANTENQITQSLFRVVGIYYSENDMFDEVNVFVRKSDLAKMLGSPEYAVNEIAVALYDHDKTKAITEELKNRFSQQIQNKELVVRPWSEIVPSITAMIKMMDYFSYIFMGIILLALAFGIVNTMLMVVMERVKELGMLKAVGMNSKRIFSMIMLETISLSLMGGIVGFVASLGIIKYFSVHGFNLKMLEEGYNAMGFSAMIYPEAEIDYFIFTTLMIIATAIIASIYPAQKALKLNPAEAIHTV